MSEQPRRAREAQEARELHHQEALSKYRAVLDPLPAGVLREVVSMHCPYHEDPHCCSGCPTAMNVEYGDEDMAAWPCETFLLIERETS